MDITTVIQELKKLDLSTYPKEQIQSLFKSVGKVGYVAVTYHRNKEVMRARPNNGLPRFEKKAEYSFKPAELNKTYQRASTPEQTMFYATSIPENIEKGELDNMRVIGVTETVPMLRDLTKSGTEKISFGKWIVQEDLNLIAIVHKEDFYKESKYTRELVDAYDAFIQQTSKEIMDRSIAFTSYLADEFAKKTIYCDYDYMISALFTELVIRHGFDGVIYPSVRVDGKGFNIAITPEATKKLNLVAAGECTIYKLKDHTIVGNDSVATLNGNEEEFKLVDLPYKEEQAKAILQTLGVNSIEDLK